MPRRHSEMRLERWLGAGFSGPHMTPCGSLTNPALRVFARALCGGLTWPDGDGWEDKTVTAETPVGPAASALDSASSGKRSFQRKALRQHGASKGEPSAYFAINSG